MEKPIQEALADEIRDPGAFTWFFFIVVLVICAAFVDTCENDHDDCQHDGKDDVRPPDPDPSVVIFTSRA